MSSFRSLYTVRTGLDAARRAMDVVGRNVANANTVGYSRQEVSFAAAEPGHVIDSAGRGISQVNILRYRDEFLDRQYRNRAGAQGYYDTRSQHLSQVEQVIGDLSEGGLRTALDNFFNSWENLATYPSRPDSRTQVAAATEEFLSVARASFDELAQVRTNLDEMLRNNADEINSAAAQLVELNLALASGKANQEESAELMDRRDMLLDSLSKLAGASSVRHADGTVNVYLGSLPLVEKTVLHEVSYTTALEATQPGQSVSTLTWRDAGPPPVELPLAFPKGEMAALVELRDQTIPEYMQNLDSLVRNLANEVNNLHTFDLDGDGTTEGFFQIGSEWMNVSLNAQIKADPAKIVAAATVPAAPGDGDLARSIASLRDAAILTGGPVGTKQVTPGDYLRSISMQVGLDVQEALRRSDATALQVTQAERQRQSVSGVSLDEEMSKMIQYQQTYNAAARMMTTIDEMLEIVVNRIGLAGR